ncbi:hypothetical protein KKC88_01225 [Patescibacteria group bacterium]|nr:hypothetical protein [Patescibacteria group bacterium]MBU1672853.1 hypothetical protein [Patescibacteria group bacterium]MBU1963726.1 hypothetical protein [Patescibacteria group bacterium]
MPATTLGKTIFVLGIIVMFVYTAFSFLWAMAGIPLPYPLSVDNESFGLFQLLTPPLGAALMVTGALIFGHKERRVT